MKKGLLLSVVASTMIFAGGDIAPVEPAAPASADFWGQIGFRYQAQDFDRTGLDWGDKINNAFSATVVLGVEKELGYGFGFGAEVAGWTDFGLDIAKQPAVSELAPSLGLSPADATSAEVSQAYLTYTFGNTAIKAGRQALPAAVSPWAWSDRSAGVLDIAYDAVVVANTDIQDTTLVGAWVGNAADGDTTVHLGAGETGIFMLAAINKSLANTTLSASGYYFPKANYKANGGYVLGKAYDMWSLWGSATGSADSINWGVQAAYVDGDTPNADATYAIAGRIGSSWGDLSARVTAAYINDGDYSMKTAGTGLGTSAFWGNTAGGFFTNGDTNKLADQAILYVNGRYNIGLGHIFGGLGYVSYGNGGVFDDGFGGRIGYGFKVMGVDSSIEYRYSTYNANAGYKDLTKQRIRVEAYYKF
jgi:hypothetical protein